MIASTYRLLLVLALPVALLLCLEPSAEACGQEPSSGLSTPLVLPEDGQSAPPNTRVWITAPIEDYYGYGDQSPLEAADLVLRSEGLDLRVRAKTVSVRAALLTHLWVLEPEELLREGQVVEVWIRGEAVSSFEVHGPALLQAPATPEVQAVDASGEYFGLLFCGEPARIEVSVQGQETLLFLTEAGTSEVLPKSAVAVGTGRRATALELPPGEVSLQVSAFDLAGNQSAATPLPRVTIPATVTGCSAGSTRHTPPLWALVILLALRALRPGHRHHC